MYKIKKEELPDKYIGSHIDAICCPVNLFYPKQSTLQDVQPGDWVIMSVDIKILQQGFIPDIFDQSWGGPDKFYNITINGNVPMLSINKLYYINCEVTWDDKYGLGYKICKINEKIDLQDPDQKRIFLQTAISDAMTKRLYSKFDDPFIPLQNGDVTALCTINGIGPKIAKKLIKKFRENINNVKYYLVLCEEYGLTDLTIQRLQLKYKSTDIIVDLLKTDPYKLMDMDGFGWEKTDALALRGGYEPLGEKRIVAYTEYILRQEAYQNGNTWIQLDYLVEQVKNKLTGLDDRLYAKLLKKWTGRDESHTDNWLYYEQATRRIALKSEYELEVNICNEINRLKNAQTYKYKTKDFDLILKTCEEENSWKYTEEQVTAIKGCLDNNIVVITGSAGCVDCDTEFFNGKQWKRIADYEDGDKVLQYNKDGTAELIYPLQYIKKPCEQLWLTQTKYGIDMCLSNEHNVIYQTSKGNLYSSTMAQIKEKHEKSISGFSGKFYTTFNYSGIGINLTDAEIKVMCAVICDGSFSKDNTNLCRFHIKKDRKKDELRKIFTEANINYKEHISVAPGYLDFYIYAPVKTKIFTNDWYNCTNNQLQIICDNILFWDGNEDGIRKRFNTTIKENADFVQFAFSACGYKTTIYRNDRRNRIRVVNNKEYITKTIDYCLQITRSNMVSIGGFHKNNPNKTKILPYKTKDGFKYCFTTFSNMWIMRRNNKIIISGNSGKTSIMKPVTRFLKATGQLFAQCSLAGKAASNLSEVTNEEGSTIHRLLGYDYETGGFSRNKKKPIVQKVIIVDEMSMNDNQIFYSLIQAISTGGKIIMLGDTNQLEPINTGNLLKDMIESRKIACYKLTKIMRQAALSGIITESLKIANQQQIITNIPTIDTRGALQDLKIVTYKDLVCSFDCFISEYKKLLAKGISYRDIMGVVPMRARGQISCLALNNAIQEIVNNDNTKPCVTFKDYTLRLGDKIVNRKNHYDTLRWVENSEDFDNDDLLKEPIFNGNTGYIVDIQGRDIIVDFTQQGKVCIPAAYLADIELGYVLSCHSAQGSQSPYVVVGIDMSAYVLLTKEWLYTALTRAKKYCILTGEIKAIRMATQTSKVIKKQTWLKELLQLEE